MTIGVRVFQDELPKNSQADWTEIDNAEYMYRLPMMPYSSFCGRSECYFIIILDLVLVKIPDYYFHNQIQLQSSEII